MVKSAQFSINDIPIIYKIPFQVSSALIKKLRRRGDYAKSGKGYCTNQITRIFGFYFALKALSTNDEIIDFHKQLELIKYFSATQSTATIYSRIKKAEKIGLLKKEGKNLIIAKWDACLAIVGIKFTQGDNIKFVIFRFNSSMPISTHYLIELAEEVESQYFTNIAILRKITQNKELVSFIKKHNVLRINPVQFLFNLQKESFLNDNLSKSDYDLIHSVQACPYRGVKKMISKRVNGNQIRATYERIAYFKRKVNSRKLAFSTNQSIETLGTARPNLKFYYNGYNTALNKPKWYLPDLFIINAKVE